MVMRWNHVGIKSADVAESLHFYCDLLGLEKLEELDIFGKSFIFVGNDTVSIEIEAGNPDDSRIDPRSQTGLYHLAFTVDDVSTLVERLKSEGVPIALEPLSTQPDRLVAFVEDPDGAFIQLIQMLK
jgi:catechol 2,3-dioxygenase-like lactoylglutathione lyase family enzyme